MTTHVSIRTENPRRSVDLSKLPITILLVGTLYLQGCFGSFESTPIPGKGILGSGTLYAHDLVVEMAEGYEITEAIDTTCFGPIEPPLTDSEMRNLMDKHAGSPDRDSPSANGLELDRSEVSFGFKEASSEGPSVPYPFLRCWPTDPSSEDFVTADLFGMVPPDRASLKVRILNSKGYSEFSLWVNNGQVEWIDWNVGVYRDSQ